MIKGKDCPTCGSEMGHNSAAQFRWCWWECTHCGHKEGNVPPDDVLKWHHEMFEK